MSDRVVGGLVLAGIVMVVVGAVLSRRRRPAVQVITSGCAHGSAGLVIHPWRGHAFAIVGSWLCAVGVTVLGLSYVDTSVFAAVVVGGAGLLLLYLVWAGASGRGGDGTLTLTPLGLHQRWRGSDVFVPWDAVTGLVTSRQELIIETASPIVPVRHLPRWLGRARVVATDEAIGLPHWMLPPLPYQEMIELYSTYPPARDELATSEPVIRARTLLEQVAMHGRATPDLDS